MSADMPDVIKYLLGEGTLEGWGFGEQPGKSGPYWWRKHLREHAKKHAELLKAAREMRDELISLHLRYGDEENAYQHSPAIKAFDAAVKEG